MSAQLEENVTPQAPAWRFKLGIVLVCIAIALWLCVPVAAWAGVPSTRIAAITGVIFIVNKILLLLVIAVMGKAGFQELKRKIFGVFRLSTETHISRARYNVGLVMFCIPLISASLEPYVDALWPELRPNMWQLQLLGDLMFFASFFVLGGNFWDKIRSLFIRSSRVVYPANPAA